MADLRTSLVKAGLPDRVADTVFNYISSAKKAESTKDKKPVTSNDATELYQLLMKFWAQGLAVDGINVVITGHNMGMVTYHGYKNKVLQVYPDSSFDVQLVREGDNFEVAKDSGTVTYSHQFGDPFGEEQIKGAYVVIKNSRGEYLELLGRKDYEQMKSKSKQAYIWGEWESEFMLKSVIKRACKRHFNDVTADIDKIDNEDYGLILDKQPQAEDEFAIQAAIDSLGTATDNDDLRTIYLGLGKIGNHPKVKAAKDALKEQFLAAPPTKGPLVEKVEEPADASHTV